MSNPVPIFLVSLAFVASSCAGPRSLEDYERDYDAALLRSRRGEHQHAAILYERACAEAELLGAPAASMAMVYYGLGRELALIGEYEAGIQCLEKSLQSELRGEPVNRIEVLRTSGLLGRVHLDQGQARQALPYLQQAYGLLKNLGSSEAPQELVQLGQDLHHAAQASGEASLAQSIALELDGLLVAHGELEAQSTRLRFTPDALAARRAADRSEVSFRDQR